MSVHPPHRLTRRQLLTRAGAAGAALLAGAWAWKWGTARPTQLPPPTRVTVETPPGLGAFDVVLVGSKQDVSTAATYESFAAAMRHWLRDIPRHAARPRLIVFPEDVGLVTAFTGLRGDLARHLGSSLGAMASLLVAYAPQVLYYHRRFPRVGLPPNNISLLWLALTDTMVRAFFGAFAPLARDWRSYVVACMPAPLFERARTPFEQGLLGDWQRPPSSPVWRAAAPAVYNTAFVFGPDGRLLGRVHKVHLVPVERTSLSLTPGNLDQVRALDLPGIGRIGIVISLDAWMPDVLDRLAQDGAEILVQPDANNGPWASRPVLTDWQPDAWKAGNWVDVQKYRSFRYNLNPMMTGNLFDIPFDGQSAVTAKVSSADSPGGYVGQAPDGGFLAVAPWVMADPVHRPLAARRRSLAARSAAMAPSASGPERNGYRAAVLAVGLKRPPSPPPAPPAPRLVADPVTLPADAPRWLPALATAPDGRLYLAFVEHRAGYGGIKLTASADGGRTFTAPVAVDPVPAAQWHPHVTVDDAGTVHVVWIDFRTGSWEVRVASSWDGGRTFGRSRPVARATGQPLATRPRVATGRGSTLFVVWSDNRLPNAVGDIWLAASQDGGDTFAPPVRVSDTPTETVEGLTYGTGYAWNPSLAVLEDRVTVAWQDFRPLDPGDRTSRRNHVRVAGSDISATRFGPSRTVAPPPPGVHQYDPVLVPLNAPGGRAGADWLCLWTETDTAGTVSLHASSLTGSSPWVRWDLPPSQAVRGSEPAVGISATGDPWMAWVTPQGTLRAGRRSPAGWTGGEIAPPAGGRIHTPALAGLPGGDMVLAWQETEAERSRIRAARLVRPPAT